MRSRLLSLKRKSLLVSLVVATIVLGLSPQLSFAQFIPCRIVNLKLTLPDLVQAGQPFQITTTLTVSCDPSVVPVVRVDLVDATTSKILTTTSIPYYPSSSSFIVPVDSQSTARSSPGSWALQVQAYVVNGINGATAGVDFTIVPTQRYTLHPSSDYNADKSDDYTGVKCLVSSVLLIPNINDRSRKSDSSTSNESAHIKHIYGSRPYRSTLARRSACSRSASNFCTSILCRR